MFRPLTVWRNETVTPSSYVCTIVVAGPDSIVGVVVAIGALNAVVTDVNPPDDELPAVVVVVPGAPDPILPTVVVDDAALEAVPARVVVVAEPVDTAVGVLAFDPDVASSATNTAKATTTAPITLIRRRSATIQVITRANIAGS
jgi:hypothetical protein